MKLLVAIAFFLLPHASFAADEPDAVYAKYHHAAMAGDLDEMLQYGLAQRRAEMRGASTSTRQATLKMAQATMPRAFKLERKVVNQKNQATLVVSGPWAGDGDRLDKIYGTVQMLMENGIWKVDDVSWSTEKPAILAAPKPAPVSPAPEKSVAKAPASTKGAPVVGSMAAGPTGKKLGVARPECVYKPVMTAQDMENCK